MAVYNIGIESVRVDDCNSRQRDAVAGLLDRMVYPNNLVLSETVIDRSSLDILGVPRSVQRVDIFSVDMGETEMETGDIEYINVHEGIQVLGVAQPV